MLTVQSSMVNIGHSFDFASCLYKTTFPNDPNPRWVYWVFLLSITPTHKKDVHFEKLKKTMSRTVRVVKIKVMPMHNGSIGCIWQMHNPSWFPMHNSPLRGSLCIENNSGLCIYQYTQSTRCVLLQYYSTRDGSWVASSPIWWYYPILTLEWCVPSLITPSRQNQGSS